METLESPDEGCERQTSSPPTVPDFCQGWDISVETGKGVLGENTTIALARKGGQELTATAWSPDVADEMIKDMIRRREYARPAPQRGEG